MVIQKKTKLKQHGYYSANFVTTKVGKKKKWTNEEKWTMKIERSQLKSIKFNIIVISVITVKNWDM